MIFSQFIEQAFAYEFCNVQMINKFGIRSMLSPSSSSNICLGIEKNCCQKQSFIKIKKLINIKRAALYKKKTRAFKVIKQLIANYQSNILSLDSLMINNKDQQCQGKYQSFKLTQLPSIQQLSQYYDKYYEYMDQSIEMKYCSVCDFGILQFINLENKELKVNYPSCRNFILQNQDLFLKLFVDFQQSIQQFFETLNCVQKQKQLDSMIVYLQKIYPFKDLKDCFNYENISDYQKNQSCLNLCKLLNMDQASIFNKTQLVYLKKIQFLLKQFNYINIDKQQLEQSENQKTNGKSEFEIQLVTNQNIISSQARVLAEANSKQSGNNQQGLKERLEQYYLDYYNSIQVGQMESMDSLLDIFGNQKLYNFKWFKIVLVDKEGIQINKYKLNEQKQKRQSAKIIKIYTLIQEKFPKRSKFQ